MSQPLQEQDLDRINDNLTQLKIADEQIKLAQRAGLDVTALKETADAHRAQLNKLKQTYFPGN